MGRLGLLILRILLIAGAGWAYSEAGWKGVALYGAILLLLSLFLELFKPRG